MCNLLFVRWDVDPVIFRAFIEFRWYTLMFILAFALGLYIYGKMVRVENKPQSLMETILWPVFLGTFLGARLGHFLFYEPAVFFNDFWHILIPFEKGEFVGFRGLASHGAAIGILIGLYYYSRKNRLPYLWTLDRIVVTIALSGFFIRMGNLMNSEVYGQETSLPWGFIFVRAGETLPRHPTQIYEALSYLFIFAVLYRIYLTRRTSLPNGVIFSLFLILIFSARFLIEFIKEAQESFEKGMTLDMGQLLSIPLILAGIVLLIWLKRNNPKARSK